MEYINAFWVGGIISVIGQILIDLTKLTPARVMVIFVTSGVILGGLGWYEKIIEYAGCGATVPISGFGNILAQGMKEGVEKEGLIGIFTTPFASASVGVSSAMLFGFISGILFKSGDKN